MILSLLLVLLVTASGALATYLYDQDTSLWSRICTGACIGLAAFGLIGFIFALLIGLTPWSIALAALCTAKAFGLLLNPDRFAEVQSDLFAARIRIQQVISRPSAADFGYVAFYVITAVLMWLIFDQAMIVKPAGDIYTGVLNNFGDLPFHLSVVTGFAFGNNYPPEDPTFAGVRFTYPFLTDFISAVFVRCGASLRDSLMIENLLLAVGFVGVLHRWSWELLRDRLAAVLTPLLVLLNGGFGFKLLFELAQKNDEGLVGVLRHLPPSFTVIPETSWRWGNAISSLLVTQRGILLGFPLAVIVFTQWWLATGEKTEPEQRTAKDKQKKKQDWDAQKLVQPEGDAGTASLSYSIIADPATARMIAAGVVAGFLPLVHAHSFVVVMGMGACIALLQRRWRLWITFALVASLIAIPQMLWSTHGSAVSASSFAWEFGWDHHDDNRFGSGSRTRDYLCPCWWRRYFGAAKTTLFQDVC